MIRNFGPESTDPRVRRAYAHAIIAKLDKGEASKAAAQEAVRRADKTRKGAKSGFGRAIVRAASNGSAEQRRQVFVAELGLPADATYADINAQHAEQRRQVFVAELGLPADATYADINAHRSLAKQ